MPEGTDVRSPPAGGWSDEKKLAILGTGTLTVIVFLLIAHEARGCRSRLARHDAAALAGFAAKATRIRRRALGHGCEWAVR